MPLMGRLVDILYTHVHVCVRVCLCLCDCMASLGIVVLSQEALNSYSPCLNVACNEKHKISVKNCHVFNFLFPDSCFFLLSTNHAILQQWLAIQYKSFESLILRTNG